MDLPPVVTGLSPKEGPPGTRVTIRGEYLGKQPSDLIGLTICGCDCLLSAEWKSPNKIIARSGPGKGRGDIIVVTRSGGIGTSTVEFRGYHETIGPMKESAVWVEEAPLQTLMWAHRSISPNSYQQDDPLGLSVEGNENKYPEDDLQEYFPDRSGDITSENFSPDWFLLENHHATAFNDLKTGLAYLRRKVDGQKEGQLSFLKKNVGSVVDQLDTLVNLKERFEADVEKYGLNPTAKLENSIEGAMTEAKELFDEVLQRRDVADSTRSTLALLTRFRFLFTLPATIEQNIKKGDYDLVINDYARVKNLFGKTEVEVFKNVLEEIDKHILHLEEVLQERLCVMPADLEEQKRLIRCLINLEAKGDPAWMAINSHYEYVMQRLNLCRQELYTNETDSAQKKTAHKYKKHVSDFNVVPQAVTTIEDITDIMSSLFPDLWRMGQSYFSYELRITPSPNKQSEYKSMILSTINNACEIIREAMLPQTSDKRVDMENLWAWLPHCLRHARACYSVLIRLDMPSQALEVVAILVRDLRLQCMAGLFRQAAQQLQHMHTKETWRVEHEGVHGGITNLPYETERLIEEVIQLVRESVLISEPRELPLLESAAAQREFNSLVQILLSSFNTLYEKLAFGGDNLAEVDCSPVISQLIGNTPQYRRVEHYSVPVFEHKLLITLSNCHFTSTEILPRLKQLFPQYGYPTPIIAIETVISSLKTLDDSIMEAYLEQKCDPLVGTIEPSMYLGRFDWDAQLVSNDISPYAKECFNNLIAVRAEVHNISPSLEDRVLMQIVETVAEELSRLMSCVNKFSVQGSQLARADITVLQDTLKNYCTQKAKNFFLEALEVIPPLSEESEKYVKTIIETFQKHMQLQILCFQKK